MLETKWCYINDICPYVPDWLEGWNYDLLEQEWPPGMSYVFPPETHVAAAMNKAILEHLKGKDIIVMAVESKLDRAFDKAITRKLGIYQQMGNVIFEPFRKQSNIGMGLYLFLTPATLQRILVTRKVLSAKAGIDKIWKDEKKQELTKYMDVVNDAAARMSFSGVKLTSAMTFFKIKHYDPKVLHSYIRALGGEVKEEEEDEEEE